MANASPHTSGSKINSLHEIADVYPALLCDVWGVLHNGEYIYQAAAEALAAYRKQGGRVVLLTNSPRPSDGVRRQLHQLNLADGVYDDIVTSGDVTRSLIAQVQGGIFHLGPSRDAPLFAGIDVTFADEADCDAVVCTGLFDDENEIPEEYRERLSALAGRGVSFICANPDIVVERGDRMIWCAGSLARLYTELGGEVRIAGKPHAPIYDLAMQKLESLMDGKVDRKQVMAIGDGMPTDVAGALHNGFDLLFITAGIHSNEYGTPDTPDPERLQAFLSQHDAEPTAWMPRLQWQDA